VVVLSIKIYYNNILTNNIGAQYIEAVKIVLMITTVFCFALTTIENVKEIKNVSIQKCAILFFLKRITFYILIYIVKVTLL